MINGCIPATMNEEAESSPVSFFWRSSQIIANQNLINIQRRNKRPISGHCSDYLRTGVTLHKFLSG